ncbi:hypothetical protein [Ralstonia pseudosolanacearum]|uniref:hypothetical protein n=1 Tax=Ralstonia pseudosolanacearum TaxID=1310165 RepID=UPI001FFB50B2|nr:hypothetical protein [Ralstonia pseudosolanacearum]
MLKDYGSAIALCVPMAGWAITNHQSNRRELRKEVRSEIDEIGDLCEKFVEAQHDYFESTVGTPEEFQASLDVKLHAKAIDLRIRRLQGRRWSFTNGHGTKEHLETAAQMWEAAYDEGTGGTFESASRVHSQIAVRAQQMQTRTKVLAFIEALHQAFLYEFDQ